MQITDILSVLFRWIHIAAGIIWIGLLYWFNFVNIPFTGTMDADTKKKVVPELMPRALYWFRWGAAYTWVTGIVLLLLVFYHGGLMFDSTNVNGWVPMSYIMLAVTFFVFVLYDVLAKSALGKNLKVFGAIGFVLIGVIVYLMMSFGGYSYRAYIIHTGTMFGTIMAGNVWMRIWPAQKKVLAAVKAGTAPDAAVAALAGQRSRHNTYLSVPLVWTMINVHTTVFSSDWWYMLIAIVVGWGLVALMYNKSAQVKGI